ncbi:MAG: phosphoribosylaminoimidazolesuccinocarboxamide synthase [Bacteroidota bacterium]|nr:phosphoribosylaminoimidazolesuccinocarboxamide synthase [Bacteroidota bacterium]
MPNQTPESFSFTTTNFKFKNQQNLYHGKVRDVYDIGEQLIIIATDRISAFDCILPRPIPYKGQVLNQISAYFLNNAIDICKVWLESTPDVNVSVGKKCSPISIEFVVRGYLAGHAAREYNSGKRILCGVRLEDGLVEGEKLPEPIITPTTKAHEGHDMDISYQDIIELNLIDPEILDEIYKTSIELFNRGTTLAEDKGLILVDTKYEFGLYQGKICLMDEIHTPDSSRYYIKEGYNERQSQGLPQIQLSKEFVREWLTHHGFSGKPDEIMPEMPEAFVWEISNRYIELFEKITSTKFIKSEDTSILKRIKNNLQSYF